MTTFRFIPVVVLMMVAGDCDWDKFTGYNYEGETLIETTQVTGKVTDLFTGISVVRANVQVGDLATQTDGNGDYLIIYPIGTEDERNRPVPITITKSNYVQFESEILIYPDKNIHNFSLIYAAPIIDSSRLEFVPPPKITCYVTVTDHQGVVDIEDVVGIFTYENDDIVTFISNAMEEDVRFSGNSARFKCNVEPDLPQYGYLISRFYQIEVTDKSGLTIRKEFYLPF